MKCSAWKWSSFGNQEKDHEVPASFRLCEVAGCKEKSKSPSVSRAFRLCKEKSKSSLRESTRDIKYTVIRRCARPMSMKVCASGSEPFGNDPCLERSDKRAVHRKNIVVEKNYKTRRAVHRWRAVHRRVPSSLTKNFQDAKKTVEKSRVVFGVYSEYYCSRI